MHVFFQGIVSSFSSYKTVFTVFNSPTRKTTVIAVSHHKKKEKIVHNSRVWNILMFVVIQLIDSQDLHG